MTPARLDRTFYGSTRNCPFKCRYCFAALDSYKTNSKPEALQLLPFTEGMIVYPSCDAEFLLDKCLIARLKSAIKETDQTLFVSVSTKAALSARLIDHIITIDQMLRSENRGFVKISVSFATKNSIATFEDKTANYDTRLLGLSRLAERNIACSVNLKPILPMIGAREYFSIVDDCIPFSKNFLLGGLYVDPNDKFGREVIAQFPHHVRSRTVDWLPAHPIWPYVLDPDQLSAIKQHIRSTGAFSFDSDKDVIRQFIHQNGLADTSQGNHARGSA